MATALELSRRLPRQRVLVLEKEGSLAAHQTGNNSGVIHSGIYYKPGSLKARNCVAGARALMEFCQENDVGYELCGKVIVATEERELPALHELHRRGTANGVPGLELVGPERLRELEPHTRGVQALWSPNTGIIDYRQVTEAYGRRFRENGGRGVDGRTRPSHSGDGGRARAVDAARRRAGPLPHQLRGALRRLGGPNAGGAAPGAYHPLPRRVLLSGAGGPVAGARASSTRCQTPGSPSWACTSRARSTGEVEAGPNAVLAFAREGYSMGRVHPGELWGTLAYRGFWAMSRRHWRTGLMEVRRSLSKAAFTRSLQRLVPEVEGRHLVRGGAGVRAQAVDRDGALADDFRISETQNAIHVLNAPSPGATASLSIERDIVDMAAKLLRADRREAWPLTRRPDGRFQA